MATQMTKSQIVETIAEQLHLAKRDVKGVLEAINGEEMMFKAKPARKIVRARPVKAAKDAV